MRRSAFVAGTAALAAGAGSAASAQAPRPLTLGVIPFDPSAEAYYAQAQGIFESVGLTVSVTPMTSGGAIAAGVVSGALDVGFSNVLSVVAAHARGIGVVIVAPATLRIAGTPILALCVARDAPYRSAKDLTGKTIAVDGLQGLTQIVTEAWVDKNGGDARSLKFVEMPEPTISAALQQGRVDAGTLQVTNVDLRPGSPVRSIADPYDAIAPRFVPAVWITTRTWLAAHPGEAQLRRGDAPDGPLGERAPCRDRRDPDADREADARADAGARRAPGRLRRDARSASRPAADRRRGPVRGRPEHLPGDGAAPALRLSGTGAPPHGTRLAAERIRR